MLLRPDATYIDKATNQAQKVFPQGTDWLRFESRMPGKDVFANSVLDPAIGLTGDLALKAFAAAEWENWISTAKVSLYEVGTRIGLPELENTGLAQGVSQVYSNIESTVSIIKAYDDPSEAVPELIKNAALQVLQLIARSTGLITRVVVQVIGAAIWAVDVVAAQKSADLAKNVSFPPLQSEDPATDTWQVNRVYEVFRSRGTGGVVYPDGGIEPASNADYTSFYLPAYRSERPWMIKERANGIAAQQGAAREARGPRGTSQYNFDIGDGSTFGFMPGTSTMLRVLQASYRYYYTVRSVPVDRYSLRCRGVDKPCYQTQKGFDGTRDCRQCVDAESVWPTEGIGWAYGGAPLNATTPGENVGAFYPSTNKLLLNLLESIIRPGPLLYTVDTQEIDRRWEDTFQGFWEFAAQEWRRYNGTGYRGLLSRLVTLMTTFDDDGEIQLGGRDPDMPLNRIATPREAKFEIPFSASIYSQIIKPFCLDLGRMQLHYLDTISVAYIPPGAGGVFHPNGKVRKNQLGDRFLTARKELLSSNKRMLVDLRQVSDPEYRAELERAGVKVSPVNPVLQGSPGVGHQILNPDIKPRRAPVKPKILRAPALGAPAKLPLRARRIPIRSATGGEEVPHGRPGLALGVAAAGVAVTSAAILGLHKATNDRDR